MVGRLTITLDDDLHRALEETAVRQQRSIGSIVDESLRLHGIGAHASSHPLVAAAREHARLDSAEALKLAVEETRAARER